MGEGMIDFVLLCREQRIPHLTEGHHHCHEGWVQTHCPFCGDGSHGWHLGFGLERGNLSCWRCGSHNSLEWLEKVLPPGARSGARRLLKQYSVEGKRYIGKKVVKIRQKNIKPVMGSEELSPAHIKYLKRRKFDPAYLVKEWGLKGTRHLSKDWNWRIITPIRDSDSRIVAYTGRTLSKETKPRWKTTDNDNMLIDPKLLIYGIDKADKEKGVLIVEGPSDVWRMGPGAVGLLGIDWSIEQAAILRHYKNRYILFDNQPVAQKKALELANWLATFPGHTEIITGLNSDPGALPQNEADNIMKELDLYKSKD